MIATVQIGDVTGEVLVAIAYGRDPSVSLIVRNHTVHLTRDEARRAADALVAVALTEADDDYGPR